MIRLDEEEKIYCFSEGEFSVLADVCGIRRMLCFNTLGGNELIKLSKREYNRTVYELCKRDVLFRNEETLVLRREIAEMITLCRTAERIVCFRNTEDRRFTACFYLPGKCRENKEEKEYRFGLVLPGSRAGEYVRMSLHRKEKQDDLLEDYLTESDELYLYDGKSLERTGGLTRNKEAEYTLQALKNLLK